MDQSTRARRVSLLERLIESDGVSGREEKVRNIIDGELKNFCRNVTVDSLGNLIANNEDQESSRPRVMLEAHMDEVGLVIKYIRPDGYLSFELSGHVDASILPSQWVRISTRKGIVRGVVGTKSAHFVEEGMSRLSHRSLVIDIGTRSREEALETGVRIGDFATYDRLLTLSSNKKYLLGKSLDNRIGCAVLIESMREIANLQGFQGVYAVATVMEEIGGMGARVATNNLRPRIAIVLDGQPASDPYVSLEQSAVEIGHGPVIRKSEAANFSANVTPIWLADLAVAVAEDERIPYQIDVTTTYPSDASVVAVSGQGVPTLPILVARQNSHSPAEIASLDDIDQAIQLTVAVVKRIHSVSIYG